MNNRTRRTQAQTSGHRKPGASARGRGRKVALIVIVTLAAMLASLSRVQPARAQDTGRTPGDTLFAGSVDSMSFPTVAVKVYAVDGAGLPFISLAPGDLLITEDGRELPADALSVTPDTQEPLNLVIALNRATPPADWDTVVAAVNGLLDQLEPDGGDVGDRVGIVAYNEAAETLITPTQDIDAVRAALVNAQPGGTQSAFYIALNQALGLFEDVEGRRALVVVTDRGNTTADGGDGTVLPALVEAARKAGVSGHVIGYGPAGANPDFLQVANGTGGRAVAVSTAGDVAPHLEALPALLRQGFRVVYDSAIPATADDHLLSLALRRAEGPPLMRGFVARALPVDVTITQPVDGQPVSGSTVIAFEAAAPAPVFRVTFSLDTGEIITSTESALGGIIWDSTGAPPGNRRLKVTVEDSAGNIGADEIGMVVVPPISLAVQMGATDAIVGNTTVLTALVNSELGGVTVEAFVGRTQVGVQANQQGAIPFVIDTTPFPPGRYGIYVKATDAQGNVATDNSQVLTLAPPASTNITPTGVWAVISAWFGRYWLWLVGALLGILLLWLLWLIVRGIVAAIQRQRRVQQAERARVIPQARMLITNTGNVRTPYRLRAESPNGALQITFLLDGAPLQPPMVTRVGMPAQATNGRYAQQAAAPVATPLATPAPAAAPAAQSAPQVSAQGAPHVSARGAYKGAAQAADVGGRFFNSLGRLIPGPAGAQLRRVGNAVVAQQTAVVRTQGQIRKTMEDAEDVGYYGQQIAPASATAGAAAGSVAPAYADTQTRYAAPPPAYAPAPPPAYAPAPQPAFTPAPPPARAPLPKAAVAVDPAFELQGGPRAVARGGAARATSPWVETPPLAPGETLGIDIHVAAQDRVKRNGLVTFNVSSAPAEGEGADVTTDAVSVRLNSTR